MVLSNGQGDHTATPLHIATKLGNTPSVKAVSMPSGAGPVPGSTRYRIEPGINRGDGLVQGNEASLDRGVRCHSAGELCQLGAC